MDRNGNIVMGEFTGVTAEFTKQENETMKFEPTVYNVYARVDSKNRVTKIFSTCFEQAQETDVLIKSGSGDEFVHVGYYKLYNGNETHRYKIENNILTECSAKEIEEEFSSFPPLPETPEQKITKLEIENTVLKTQQNELDELILDTNYQLLLLQENITDIV